MHTLVSGPTTFLLCFDNIFRDQDTFFENFHFFVYSEEAIVKQKCSHAFTATRPSSSTISYIVAQSDWTTRFPKYSGKIHIKNRGIDFDHHRSLSHMQAREECGAVPPYFSHFSTICNFSGSSGRSGSLDVVYDRALKILEFPRNFWLKIVTLQVEIKVNFQFSLQFQQSEEICFNFWISSFFQARAKTVPGPVVL